MARKRRKPLFAGLSIDLPTGPEMYADHFYRQQAAEGTQTLLKTPPTPPNRRRMPGDRSPYDPIPADMRLVTTRGKNGIRESVGTPSVPARTRKTPGEKIHWATADGKRRSRSLQGYPTRVKDAEKTVYSARTGMSARPTPTREEKLVRAEIVAAREAVRVRAADPQAKLNDAIGRERDALSRGDTKTAESARAEIRALRKSIRKGA